MNFLLFISLAKPIWWKWKKKEDDLIYYMAIISVCFLRLVLFLKWSAFLIPCDLLSKDQLVVHSYNIRPIIGKMMTMVIVEAFQFSSSSQSQISVRYNILPVIVTNIMRYWGNFDTQFQIVIFFVCFLMAVQYGLSTGL